MRTGEPAHPASSQRACVDRRQLLRLVVAGSGALWLPRSAWSQPRLPGNPFNLGIASGSPSHDSVVLWTRLLAASDVAAFASGPITVQWELAHDEQFAHMVQRGQVQALPELAHAVHVEPMGLAPDRWYFYRFIAGGNVSPVGRTRTFPAPDSVVARLRLAYASCQRWEHGYYGAYRHMLAEDLDTVLFLGDYIYEYGRTSNPVRVHTDGWALTLADYRRRHALHKSDRALQNMHAACPWLLAWDDHEVQNDYAGLEAGENGPAVEDFAARRAAAYQAYYEHMPVRAGALARAVAGLNPGAGVRLYSEQRFGRLANILMLDTRQYRDPLACGRPGKPGSHYVNPALCPQWNDPARSLLGLPQERWFDGVLAGPRQGWTIIGQQTLFGQRDARPGFGESLWNDGWDGYSAARSRLTQSLQKHEVGNMVMLGGDIHQNWVGHVKADYLRPDSATLGVEFCGTSLTSRSSGGEKEAAERLAENPHFTFADSQARGYGVAEFTPGRLTTTLRAVDDVTLEDPRIRTLTRFTVEAGRPRVDQA